MTGGTPGGCCPPPAGDLLPSWAASTGLGLLLHRGLGVTPQPSASGWGEAGPGAGGQPSARPWGLCPPRPVPVPAGARRADRAWDRKSAEKQPGLQTSERGLAASLGRGFGAGCPPSGQAALARSARSPAAPTGRPRRGARGGWGGMCWVQIPLGSPGLCPPRTVSNAWHAPSGSPAELPAHSSLLRSRLRPEPRPASPVPIPLAAPATRAPHPCPHPRALPVLCWGPHTWLLTPRGLPPQGAASRAPTAAPSAPPRHCICPNPPPQSPQTPRKPGRDKVWGEALRAPSAGEESFGRRASAPEGPRCWGRDAFPAAGTSHPSAQLGDLNLPPGAQGHPPAPHASAPRSRSNAGQRRGFGRAQAGFAPPAAARTPAHTCTHAHVLVPSHTPQQEPLIPLIGCIVAIQPAPVCSLSTGRSVPAGSPLPRLRDAVNTTAAVPRSTPRCSLTQTARKGCLHPSRRQGRTLPAWHGAVVAASCRHVPSGLGKPGLDQRGQKNPSSAGLALAARSQPGRALTRRRERAAPTKTCAETWERLKAPKGSLGSEYARAKAFGTGPRHPDRALRSRRAGCRQPGCPPPTPFLRAGSVPAPRQPCRRSTGSAGALTTGCSSPGTWLRWGSCGRRGHSLDGKGENPGERPAALGVPPAPPWLQGGNTKGKINAVLKARRVPGCSSAPPDLRARPAGARWGPACTPREQGWRGTGRVNRGAAEQSRLTRTGWLDRDKGASCTRELALLCRDFLESLVLLGGGCPCPPLAPIHPSCRAG